MAKKTKKQATVLVVDDDIGVREVFAEVLTSAGYRVQVAEHADAATKIIKKQHIDLALIDIWLKPGIDGLELIKQWNEGSMLTFPLAVISGHAEVPIAVLAMRLGAIDVLTKPISAKVLLDFVEKTLQKHADKQLDVSLQQLNIGTVSPLVEIRGQLHKAAGTSEPVMFIGPPTCGSRFFARLLHPVGKPWCEPLDFKFLTKNPTEPIKGNEYGTIYMRGVEKLTDIEQRGVFQLIHNAKNENIRFITESEVGTKQLRQKNKLIPDLAELFANHEIEVPALKDYSSNLKQLITVASKIFAADTNNTAGISDEALAILVEQGARWHNVGLTGLLAFIRILLEIAGATPVTPAHINGLLSANDSGASVEVFDKTLCKLPLREARNRFDSYYFKNLMEYANGNYAKAAEISGLERSYLYRKVRSLTDNTEET